jgi:Carboxypeptidase regulatory-like domain
MNRRELRSQSTAEKRVPIQVWGSDRLPNSSMVIFMECSKIGAKVGPMVDSSVFSLIPWRPRRPSTSFVGVLLFCLCLSGPYDVRGQSRADRSPLLVALRRPNLYGLPGFASGPNSGSNAILHVVLNRPLQNSSSDESKSINISRQPETISSRRYELPISFGAPRTEGVSIAHFVSQNALTSAIMLQASRLQAGQQMPGAIAGTVRDSSGGAMVGVQVKLIAQNGTSGKVSTTDTDGAFVFGDLVPGVYQVKINAIGLTPWASGELALSSGERRQLQAVTIDIPTTKSTVNVEATLRDVAEAQVAGEEKQRVLGVLPNVYTSYIWDAAPMTPKLKFRLALRSSLDPVTLLVAAGVAGVEQAHNSFPGYDQGFEGYAQQYGSAYADTVVGRFMGSAVLPILLHQDPRYFYRGSGSVRSRILYALAATVICRGDNGRPQPNYSRVLGSFAAAGISNIYRSPEDRQASLTLRNGLIVLGGDAVSNVLRELFSRKLTRNVPTFANGKP